MKKLLLLAAVVIGVIIALRTHKGTTDVIRKRAGEAKDTMAAKLHEHGSSDGQQ